jgi:hypothetical protein
MGLWGWRRLKIARTWQRIKPWPESEKINQTQLPVCVRQVPLTSVVTYIGAYESGEDSEGGRLFNAADAAQPNWPAKIKGRHIQTEILPKNSNPPLDEHSFCCGETSFA